MATRFDIERAVLASALPPSCRHLMHVLCVRIDARAGLILAVYQPSLTDLARDTGRHRRSVMRFLRTLEKHGWIIRDRPPAELSRQHHHRTRYTLLIPGPGATDQAVPGLGTQSREARGQAVPGLGTQSREARGQAVPGLGTQSPEARGTTALRSSGHQDSSGPDLEAVINAIKERDGEQVSAEWARRVLEQITGGRDIRHAGRYAARAIAAAPRGTYSPTPQPPPPRDLCARCGQPGHQAGGCTN